MPVDRPIFVLGPPRSGTSLLYEFLGSHPDVGYFNRANRKLVHLPGLAHLLTRLGVYGDAPRESSEIWDRFRGDVPLDADDVMTEAEVTPRVRAFYARLIERVLELRGATRFAAKLPSHSARVRWLEAVFPDAIFLLALRDWRAVVSSTVLKRRRDFDGGWFGVRLPGWKEAEQEPHAMGAAWQLVTVQEHLEELAASRPGRFFSVWYEDLCLDPAETMRRVCEHSGLRYDDEVRALLPRDVRTPQEKWRRVLGEEEVQAIRERFGDRIERLERTLENAPPS